MKLESLKSSKFDTFQKNALSDCAGVVGGKCIGTHGIGEKTASDYYQDSSGSNNEKDYCEYSWGDRDRVKCERTVSVGNAPDSY